MLANALANQHPMPPSSDLERAQSEGLEANARRALSFFGHRGRIEFQALGVPSGRFKESLVAHAESIDEAIRLLTEIESRKPTAVYVIANEVDDGATTRVPSRGRWVAMEKGASTTDNDITHRNALYLDFDALRTKHTSATDEEMRPTDNVRRTVRDRLIEILGNDSAVADGHSGNGRSLFVALDRIPESPELAETIKEILVAVSAIYSTRAVEVDTSVGEAKRLSPAFGTKKRKGAPGIPERPHRSTALVCCQQPTRIGFDELRGIRDAFVADLDAGQRTKFDVAFKRKGPTATGPTLPKGSADYDDVFAKANAVAMADVLAWKGLLRADGRPVCPGCGSDDQGVAILDNNGLKCSHARCAEKGVRNGFRTATDVVTEVERCKPIDAVRAIGERFGFEVAKPPRKQREAKPKRLEVLTGGTSRDDWKRSLVFNNEGELRPVAANVITILANDPRWVEVFGYDESRDEVVKTKPAPWHAFDAPAAEEIGTFTDNDATRIGAWLSREPAYNLNVRNPIVIEAIGVVAHRHHFHPIRDFLTSLRWDGTVRLGGAATPGWLTTYAGADDNAYVRGVSVRALIAATARVIEPGCKVDTVPVLRGEQGRGKSTLLRALAVRDSWFFDSDLDIGDKDAPQALRGKWIVEFGELSALNRRDLESLKAFVTRQIDTYRPSFGRVSQDFPRRWAAFGSTNKDRFLTDPTGNRRWWPIETGTIRVDELRRDVGQLWAEARTRYEQREEWHVNTAEFAKLCTEEQEARTLADPWEQAIGSWMYTNRVQIAARGYLTTASVLASALTIEPGRWTRSEEMRVADILGRLGCKRGERRAVDGVRVYPYLPPIHEVAAQPANEVRQEVGQTNTWKNTLDPNLPNLPNLSGHSVAGEEGHGSISSWNTPIDPDRDQGKTNSKGIGWEGRAGWAGGALGDGSEAA